jgi:hypothetical protein
MSKACWELNPNCSSKSEEPVKTPCPSFEQKINCWELDWKPFIRPLSEEEKMVIWEWRRDNCPQCPAYKEYQREIDLMIKSILSEL